MANRKFLFVNANNDVEEEVISVSASGGVGDAGKLATLDASGKWDPSMIPALDNSVDWKESCRVAVESNVTIASPGASLDGVSMNNGDRVLLAGQTSGEENGIYVFNGAASAMTRSTDADEDSEVTSQLRTPIEEGTRANQIGYLTTNDPIVVDTTVLVFAFQDPSNLIAGAGIDITSSVVAIDLLDSDSGLELVGAGNAAELAIDFADPATEMGTARAVRASDLSGNGTNQGAKILGADPATISQSSATTIQGILEDLSDALELVAAAGVSLTAGAGGVTVGDLVYISANDTGLPLDVTTDENAIGIADSTVAAAAGFVALADQQVLTGVLAGATAGDRWYWDGSDLVASAPGTPGSTVWQAGYALNATDLVILVRRIKKNS